MAAVFLSFVSIKFLRLKMVFLLYYLDKNVVIMYAHMLTNRSKGLVRFEDGI